MLNIISKIKNHTKTKRKPLLTTVLLVCVLMTYQNCQQSENFYAKENLQSKVTASPVGNDSDTKVDDSVNPVEPSNPSNPANPTIPENPLPPIVEVPVDPKEPSPIKCDSESGIQNVICNPLGGNPKPIINKGNAGLIGNLYEGKPQWKTLDTYFELGDMHPENLYFSNFEILTRSFLSGFGIDNNFLKNRNGEKLIEWFAIKIWGQISIPENEQGGDYHFATTSDDGIRVRINNQEVISNPTIHAPKTDCAKSVVSFTKNSKKKFALEYFQGPRTQIALVLYVKKVDASSLPVGETVASSCAKLTTHQKLLDAGYKVVSPEWFTLPEAP